MRAIREALECLRHFTLDLGDRGTYMLAVVFADSTSFRDEWEETLSKGGVFVPTHEEFELRSRVEVGIELAYCKELVVLGGEVVHCIPAELANAGAVPGVAVQFDQSMKELRETFSGWLGEAPEPELPAPPESENAERRRDPRQPARVQARICNLNGDELSGLTRNLSASGILFSVSGDALAIGDRVKIRLKNSVSGESLEIPGQVVRHVEGEAGDVPALGIRFGPGPEIIERSRDFLKRLRSAEHSRRLGGIKGDIAEMGLANLLESFGQSCSEGTITLMQDHHEGYIAFVRGTIVACKVGPVSGAKAFARLLAWKSGSFEFHARIESDLVRDPPIQLQAALLDAAREFDEVDGAAMLPFDPSERFVVDAGVVTSLAGEFDKIESAILELLGVGANVRKLLDVIPESDARVGAALVSLVEVEAIRSAS